MYNIQGDGSVNHTIIHKDGTPVCWDECEIRINEEECVAVVDGVYGKLDRMILSAVYLVISEGSFSNSRVIFNDAPLRGLQSLVIRIARGEHPVIKLNAVLLPNIIEDVK